MNLTMKLIGEGSRSLKKKKAANRQPKVILMPGFLSTPGAWFPSFPQAKEIAKLFIPQTIRE